MKKKLFLFLIIGALLVFTIPGYAALLTYNLNFAYEGTEPAGGSSPWLIAQFDAAADGLADGAVRLTMNAIGLTGSEKVGKWVFNATGDEFFLDYL